jgi:DNA helicase-2/ATP-dependent DNA helicase PcrA
LLTNARSRHLFGQDARPFRESRFLDDIPDACVARPVRPPPRAVRQPAMAERRIQVRDNGISVEYEADAGFSDEAETSFHLGQRVRHPKFGEGEVRGLTGSGRDLKLTVYFPTFGPKTIIARFVELV